MSKRGLVAYSDALRSEYAGALEVTTVYPGYIRTSIHDDQKELGVQLGDLVPEERLDDAVATMVRAALGTYARDLATTRMGAVEYAFLRHLPRRAVDWGVQRQVRRGVRRGRFTGDGPVAELAARLRA
jgi:short-subunit dehydrogenase